MRRVLARHVLFRRYMLRMLILVAVLCTSAARADVIPPDEIVYDDPAILHIGGGYGTPCEFGCGGHPNYIDPFLGTVSISQVANADGAVLDNPILLILGVANHPSGGSIFSSLPIASVTSYDVSGNSAGGLASFASNIYGLSGTGYFGNTFDAGYKGDVYKYLNLAGWQTINGSNSFANWSSGLQTYAGITATNFGMYVFALDRPAGQTEPLFSLGPKGVIDIVFAPGALPAGSFAVAYAQKSATILRPNGRTVTSVKIYSTPITESGLTGDPGPTGDPVPEPASILLLGTGLLGLGHLLRRRTAMGRPANASN